MRTSKSQVKSGFQKFSRRKQIECEIRIRTNFIVIKHRKFLDLEDTFVSYSTTLRKKKQKITVRYLIEESEQQ